LSLLLFYILSIISPLLVRSPKGKIGNCMHECIQGQRERVSERTIYVTLNRYM
jgi:hypothetical protein